MKTTHREAIKCDVCVDGYGVREKGMYVRGKQLA